MIIIFSHISFIFQKISFHQNGPQKIKPESTVARTQCFVISVNYAKNI